MHMTGVMIIASLFVATGEASVASAAAPVSVKQILDAWDQRADAYAAGDIEWEIADEKFGRFETTWVPVDSQANVEIGGQLVFSGPNFQYISRSFEYPEFGYSLVKGTNEREFYRSALLSKFPDPAAEQRELLSYTLTMTQTVLTHAWHGGNKEYPRAVILPTSSLHEIASLARATAYNSDSAENFSGVPSPVLHQLLTLPLLLAFRPSLFDARLTSTMEDMMIEVKQATVGQENVVMRLPADSTDENSLTWKFFLDAGQDYSIRRAIGYREERAVVQLDVLYDQPIDGVWAPKQWTVLTLGAGPAVVTQIVTAIRTECDLQKQPNAEIAFKEAIPPLAWVEDLVAGRRFLALEDGPFEIDPTQNVTLTYPQVLAISRGEEIVPRTVSWKNMLRRQLIALTRWPGLALPLGVIGVGMFLVIRFSARKPKEPKSDE